MTAVIGLLMQVLDVLMGTLGLLLILRILLPVFKMRWDHPVLKMVTAITTPILRVTNRWFGIPSYGSSYRSSGTSQSDLLSSAAALLALWAGRTLVVWVLRLIILIPVWVAQPLTSIGGMLSFLFTLVFDLYGLALFVRVLFSWIRISYSSPVARFLWKITEPLLGFIRSVLPPLPGIDISPLIAFFLLRLLQQVVFAMLSWIF
jgi:YggT family protein